jgi:hypothetical protein
MNACADCGRPVDGGTYCDACTGDDRDATTARTRGARSDGVSSPRARAVAVLLALAAVLGGIAAVRSLVYVPEALAYFDPVDSVGFLVVQGVNVAFVAAFTIMAKRLFDGTAGAARYGRVLQALAATSVVVGALVLTLPDGVVRWLPAVFDPGYVTLSVAARSLAPVVLSGPLATFGLGVAGASVSFAAGTALRRDPAE